MSTGSGLLRWAEESPTWLGFLSGLGVSMFTEVVASTDPIGRLRLLAAAAFLLSGVLFFLAGSLADDNLRLRETLEVPRSFNRNQRTRTALVAGAAVQLVSWALLVADKYL
jgi:hypothetical protein